MDAADFEDNLYVFQRGPFWDGNTLGILQHSTFVNSIDILCATSYLYSYTVTTDLPEFKYIIKVVYLLAYQLYIPTF